MRFLSKIDNGYIKKYIVLYYFYLAGLFKYCFITPLNIKEGQYLLAYSTPIYENCLCMTAREIFNYLP